MAAGRAIQNRLLKVVGARKARGNVRASASSTAYRLGACAVGSIGAAPSGSASAWYALASARAHMRGPARPAMNSPEVAIDPRVCGSMARIASVVRLIGRLPRRNSVPMAHGHHLARGLPRSFMCLAVVVARNGGVGMSWAKKYAKQVARESPEYREAMKRRRLAKEAAKKTKEEAKELKRLLRTKRCLNYLARHVDEVDFVEGCKRQPDLDPEEYERYMRSLLEGTTPNVNEADSVEARKGKADLDPEEFERYLRSLAERITPEGARENEEWYSQLKPNGKSTAIIRAFIPE